jgi:hypothetical protein
MYSIKPGRGPSFGGVVGGIIAAVFGVIWTIGAASMGAPPFFALFGVVFVLVAIGGTAYNLYNATSRNRFSNFDITTPGEENDPLDVMAHKEEAPPRRADRAEAKFCSQCGTQLENSYKFCPKCGKEL